MTVLIRTFFAALSIVATAHAHAVDSNSAARPHGVDFHTEIAPFLDQNTTWTQASPSAAAARKPLAQVALTTVAVWNGDHASLQAAFESLRDRRYLYDTERRGFARRLAWLYPDDGCAARAELAAEQLHQTRKPWPTKVFLFGNLSIKTPFHKRGEVEWWYHVAPAYRLGNDIFVLDPSVDPLKPSLFTEWVRLISAGETKLTASLCDANAFNTDSTCLGSARQSASYTVRQERWFLTYEWRRLVTLRLKPEILLGDRPPWAHRRLESRPPAALNFPTSGFARE